MNNQRSMEPLPIPKACALRGRDIHDMVGVYANEDASWQGRQESLLAEVLGLDPSNDPALVVLAWDIKPTLAQQVCLVEMGSPDDPWLLRIVQAPEGMWLGLHRAGPAAVPWQSYFDGLADIVASRPLEAEVKIDRSLSAEEWSTLITGWGCHFGEWQGAASRWWPSCTIPLSVEIDMVDCVDHGLNFNSSNNDDDDDDHMDVDGQGGNAGGFGSAPFTHSQGGNAGIDTAFNHNVNNGVNNGQVVYAGGLVYAPGGLVYAPFNPAPSTDSQGGNAGFASASYHNDNNGPGQVARGSSPEPATFNTGESQGGQADAHMLDDQGASTHQSAPAPVTRNDGHGHGGDVGAFELGSRMPTHQCGMSSSEDEQPRQSTPAPVHRNDGQPQGSNAGAVLPAALNYPDNHGHGGNVGAFELSSRMPTHQCGDSSSEDEQPAPAPVHRNNGRPQGSNVGAFRPATFNYNDNFGQGSNTRRSAPDLFTRNNGQPQGSNVGVSRPATSSYTDNNGHSGNVGAFELSSRMPTQQCGDSSGDEQPGQSAPAPVHCNNGQRQGSNAGVFRPAAFNYADNHGHGGNTGSWSAQSTNRTGRAQAGDNSGLASAPRTRHMFDNEGSNTRRSRSPPLDRRSSNFRSRSPVTLDRGSTKRRSRSPGPSDEGPKERRSALDAVALANNGAQGGDVGSSASAPSNHTDNHGHGGNTGSWSAQSTNRTGRAQAGDNSGLASAPRTRHMPDNEGLSSRRSRSPPLDRCSSNRRSRSPLDRSSRKRRSRSPDPSNKGPKKRLGGRAPPELLALVKRGAQGGNDSGSASASFNHTDNRGRGENAESFEPASSFDPASRGRPRQNDASDSEAEVSKKRRRSPSLDAANPRKTARIAPRSGFNPPRDHRRSRSPLDRGRSRSPMPSDRHPRRRRRTPPDAFDLSEPGAQGGRRCSTAFANSVFGGGETVEETADYLESIGYLPDGWREERRRTLEKAEAEEAAAAAAKKAEEETFDLMATGVASVAVGGPVVDPADNRQDDSPAVDPGGDLSDYKSPEPEEEGGEMETGEGDEEEVEEEVMETVEGEDEEEEEVMETVEGEEEEEEETVFKEEWETSSSSEDTNSQ